MLPFHTACDLVHGQEIYGTSGCKLEFKDAERLGERNASWLIECNVAEMKNAWYLHIDGSFYISGGLKFSSI